MDNTCVTFCYRNHRDEVSTRRVRPIRIWFGCTAWHPEAQWLLEGWDLDREGTRDYALAGIIGEWVSFMAQPNEGKVCCWCKKPIIGKVYYQDSNYELPTHKDCTVSIK